MPLIFTCPRPTDIIIVMFKPIDLIINKIGKANELR